jgi:hypothetical protein
MIFLKKVSLKKNQNFSVYSDNRKELGFLPQLVLFLCTGVGIYIFCSYFNILAWALPEFSNSNPPKKPEEYVSKSSLVSKNNPTYNFETEEKEVVSESLNVTISGVLCNLKFTSKPAEDIILLTQSDQQGFWLTNNCGNLKMIQILQSRADLVNINNREDVLFKNLKGELKAVIYFESKASDLTIDSFSQELIRPVFPDEIKYSQATASDLVEVDQDIFYLQGDCQDFAKNQCQLWLNQKGVQKDLLFTDFEKLKGTLEKEYKIPITNFRFAKNQDSYPRSLSLISNLDDQKMVLIRLELTNNQIIQNLLIDSLKDRSSYQKYNR